MPSMLSTIDNPYNPFKDFQKWYMWDMDQGYDCCGYLARLALTTDEFSDDENSQEIEDTIDEIVASDPINIYIKVSE